MVKTIITPFDNYFHLLNPQNYIGKEIEILMYIKEELIDSFPASKPSKAARFKGIFTKEEGAKFNEYLTEARDQ
jgi:hypothetical protein